VRIERLRKEHGVKIRWVHFPLHPETPPEGRSLEDLFRGRNVDRKAMHAQMKARMDAEGLPYGERTMTYNSRLAQELGKWADTQPGGEALHDALFRAYFVDARDISRPDVLLEIAGRVGLPVDAAREVLEKRTFKAAVDEDWKLSRQIGVTGVPTFVAGRRGVVGAQPYETLEELVRRAVGEDDAGDGDAGDGS
jgi:predicted DsbA family dithiol-disulfide isomerase